MKKLASALIATLLFTACDPSSTNSNKTPDGVDTSPVQVSKPQVRFTKTAAGVATNSSILVVFTQDMKTSTYTGNVKLFKDGNSTEKPITLNPTDLRHLEITPDQILEDFTNYTLVLTENVENNNSVPLDKNYTYEFRTSNFVDNTPLVATSITPKDQNNTSIYTSIAFTFNKLISSAGVTVDINSTGLTPTIGHNNILVRTDGPLEYNTTYEITISPVNSLSSAPGYPGETFTFRTQAEPTSVDFFDLNQSTGQLYVSKRFLMPITTHQSGSIGPVLEINGTQINQQAPNANVSYLAPTEFSALYNEQLFTGVDNVLDRHSLANYGSQEEENITFDYNITNIYADNDIFCITSLEQNLSEIYASLHLSAYSFFSPLNSFPLPGANDCYVTPKNQRVYLMQNNQLAVYSVDPSTNVIDENNITESNISVIAHDNTHIYLANNDTIKVYGEMNQSFASQLDLNETINDMKVFDNKLFVATVNSNVHVINLHNPLALVNQHTINTFAAPQSIDFSEQFLLVGYITGGLSRGIDMYDISSLVIAPVEKQNTNFGKINKSVNLPNYIVQVSDTNLTMTHIYEHFTVSTPLTSAGVDVSFYYDKNDTNNTYIGVAKPAEGVEIFRVLLDVNGSASGFISERNVSAPSAVNAVQLGQFLETNGTRSDKLLLGTEEHGFLVYDISNINAPVIEFNSTTITNDIGAIRDFSAYNNDGSNIIRFALSDYENEQVLVFERNASGNYYPVGGPIETNGTSPRGLSYDPVRHDLFIALGAQGIMGVQANSSTAHVLPTPGFAMDVRASQESESNATLVVVADYTGTAIFHHDNNGSLDPSHFYFSGFVEHDEAILATSILTENNTVRGIISSSTAGSLFQFGSYEGASSDQYIDQNDPVDHIRFDINNSQTTPLDALNDPFL